ncbi:cardiolipin synthetase [Streptomyces sp. S4.7]|uniref:SHOCT domain-containing protein n=1 Tax=Streptomyces sp. S4.7 TaxID=2705439 RepID=UPI0013994E4A|nr:SHOCT domain-containing protein [Streptomyces sp. S4.7]QHY98678.1 cardiolipin synthetase [Streptomyces sp. S4.7]
MTGEMNLANDYPILGAFWTVLFFVLSVLWLILLFRIIADILRDDMAGGVKAGWLLFVILLPFLGVFVYVAVRGRGMGEREQRQTRARQQDFDSYIRATAGAGTSQAEQLAKLVEMHDRGAISDHEFQKAKTKVLH